MTEKKQSKIIIWTAKGSAASRAITAKEKSLVVRLLAGAWCLACFVLITAFSSVLISFLTTIGDYKPLVNSVNDLPSKPDVRLTVNKDWGPDTLFQVEHLKKL